MKKKLIIWLIDKKAISEEDAELYEYALDSLMFMFFPLMIFIVLGIAMGDVLCCFFIMGTFLTIRRYAGGFHAESPVVCLVASTIILLTSYFVPRVMPETVTLIPVSVAAAVIVGLVSPIENKNKLLTADEKHRNKIKTIVVSAIWLCIETAMYIAGIYIYCVNIATGIFLVLCMQLLCVFTRCRV